MVARKNILIIAGEKSGEDHLMSFFPLLKRKFENYDFWGVGGDEAEAKGVELLFHLKNFGSMGISDVLGKIPYYFSAMDKIVKNAIKKNTEAAILIDFQDFNLRLAKRLSDEGVKVFYYVAPQAWVWRPSRVKKLIKYTDHLFCILPFERKWFSDRGVKNVSSVLHPVYRKIDAENRWPNKNYPKEELLLLPGSRNSEVLKTLPVFLDAISTIDHGLKVSIVKTSSVRADVYEKYSDRISKFYDSKDLYDALKEARFCLAASGTATLSCALMGVPTIVGYKVSLLNELFYRVFVPYKGFIALANLIAEEEVFPELIQDRFNVFEINTKLSSWLADQNIVNEIIKKTCLVRDKFLFENEDVVDTIFKKMQK